MQTATTMVLTTEVSIYPNPFDSFIILEITCEEDTDCIILLADLGPGRIIRMLGAGLKTGINRISLDDLQSLPVGQYQLDVKTAVGESIYQTMLIKQS
jgi:hypothetical protein